MLKRENEVESIVVENHRSEYYILNREFFDFLTRTSMECLIQIEPGEEWSGEASVKTRLLNIDSSQDEASDDDVKEQSSSIDTNIHDTSPRKYILPYRHFEQLGKTMENLIQLAAVAKRWQRFVVKPGVQNSRLSLEPSLRTYPMDVYFNVSRMNTLLLQNGYSKLVRLESFLRDCNYVNMDVQTTIVHFLYNDFHRGNTKTWYHLKNSRLQEIFESTLSTGWTDCPFIDQHLNFAKTLRGIRTGRQVCVNPEVILTESSFQEKVLRDDKCIIFVEWRGFGKARTHFSLSYWPFLTPRKLQHNIPPSHLIEEEVTDFKKSELSSSYISVHLRTERLLLGNSFKKLKLCIDHVVYLAGILQELRGVRTVFLATDLTRFGSDAFVRRKFYTSNVTGSYEIRSEELAQIHGDAVRRMNAITYYPSKELFTKDKGMVSLVEMNILKGGMDLITVGSGSFRAWLVSVFRQHQNYSGRQGYTISEICNDGSN